MRTRRAPSSLLAKDRSHALARPHACVGHEVRDVQDGHDLAGAENGDACDVVDLLQVAAERLDHDLLLADEPVHDEAHPLTREPDRHDRHLRRLLVGLGDIEDAREPHHGDRPALTADDLAALGLEDLGRIDPQRLFDRARRQREHLIAAPQQQRTDDGQRQRDGHAERRALAQLGLHVDRALELLDDELPDDVHPDAAARDLGDDGCGREACLEDQVDRFTVGHRARLGLGEVALADRGSLRPSRDRCRRRRRRSR